MLVVSLFSFFSPPAVHKAERVLEAQGRTLYGWEASTCKPEHRCQMAFQDLKLVESLGTIKEELMVFWGTNPSICLLTEAGDTFI